MPSERRQARSKTGEVLVRKHLWLYEEDMVLIEGLFGGNIGQSAFVRTAVRTCLRNMLARNEAGRRQVTAVEIAQEVQTHETAEQTETGSVGGSYIDPGDSLSLSGDIPAGEEPADRGAHVRPDSE